jgi:archaellin
MIRNHALSLLRRLTLATPAWFLPLGALAALTATPALSQTIVSAQDAGITATSNVITAAHVPVQTSAGTSFFDLSITLTPTMSGATVTGLRATTKSSSPSPSLITDGFMPGTYMDANGTTYTLGGGQTSGSQTLWSIAVVNMAGPFLASANWDTDDGPNNPEYPLLEKYKITTTAFAFGASGGQSSLPNDFNTGHLIGASASGSTISICSFEDGNGSYHTSPTACITLYFQHS